MRVYGALENAQIEWFTVAGLPSASSYPYRVAYCTDSKQFVISDGTNWLPSQISIYTAGTLPSASSANQNQLAFITDTLQVKVSTGTVWKTIGARLDTFTNGTLPAASSNTNSIVWVSDLQQVQVSNGTSWVQVGSKAGSKNYFQQSNANADFEGNAISPWTLFTTTISSGVPTTLTASATQMAFAATATTPLAGVYSGQLVKSAANAVGQGVISGLLTIDREDLGKMLYGSFAYEVTSGAANFDASGTSTQSLEIWIYNVTGAYWIQPQGYRGINQNAGPGKVVFSFQTDSLAANNTYKVVVLTAQTAATTYTINVDDFQLGPAALVLGVPATDWISYTPAILGVGTPSSVEAYWARSGSNMLLRGKFTCGTTTGVELRIPLPSGYVSADTTKIATIEVCGKASQSSSVAVNFGVLIEPSVAYMTMDRQDASNGGLTKIIGTNISGTVGYFASIPIQGWSSNVQMSSDTDTRVCAAAAYASANGTGSTTQTINYDTKLYDTHNAVSASAAGTGTWKFTAPISGFYSVKFISVLGSAIGTVLYKNGVASQFSYVPSGTYAGAWEIQLNAGDFIDLRFASSGTWTGGAVASASICQVYIARLSGPSVIAASESVNAKYNSTAAAAFSTSDAVITFATKEFDSHNAFSGTTFTAPVSGVYNIGIQVLGNSALGLNNFIQVSIWKNGSKSAEGRSVGTNQGSQGYEATTRTLLRLNAGDTITFEGKAGVAGNYSANAYENFIDISRVGN